MSKDTLYPSQINTKTISCRISSVDYVSFLNDALSKGITLNDWLLLKIYSNQTGNISTGNISNSELDKIINDLAQKDSNTSIFNLEDYIEQLSINNIELESAEGVIYIIDSLIHNIETLLEMNNKKRAIKKEPNIMDIKAQILTISQTKFKDKKELKDYMSDINELLEELV
jgi:hypothetical protein